MEKARAIVELRVVQRAMRGDEGELVYTGFSLQWRAQHDPVWRDVPVVLKVEGED